MGELGLVRLPDAGGEIKMAQGHIERNSGGTSGTISLAAYGFAQQPSVMLTNANGTTLDLTTVTESSFSWHCGRDYCDFYWLAIGK